MLQSQQFPKVDSKMVVLTWDEGIETIRYDVPSRDEQLPEMRITCSESVAPCLEQISRRTSGARRVRDSQ